MPVYHDRYIKTKIRPYGDTVSTNFCVLNVSKYFLLVYEWKYYLQVYLDNCAYKIVEKHIIGYLDDNYFESDED